MEHGEHSLGFVRDFNFVSIVSACWEGCFVFGTERDTRGLSLLTGQMQCSGESTNANAWSVQYVFGV